MKSIIKGLFMTIMMCVCLTSCRDDAELPDRGPVMHPEIETAGVYSGIWTRVNTTTEAEEVVPGTMTLTAGSEAYITEINIKADELNLDLTAMANIAPGGVGYQYQNTVASNPFGNIFSGNITKDFEIDIFFKISIKEGRKTTTYRYSFVGKKGA